MSFPWSSFRVEVHVFIHNDGESAILAKLDQVLTALDQEKAREVAMAATLDDLTTQVTSNTTVIESAVTLINGLAAQLASIKNDPVKIQALIDELNAKDQELAAAVAANTTT